MAKKTKARRTFKKKAPALSGLTVENVPCADLSTDPSNLNTHNAQSVGAVAASLRRFGQQKPIVVTREGVVVAGNGTLEAARMLSWESIQVVRTDLEGAEAIAYAIADNRTAEFAEWDEPALAAALAALEPEQREAAGFSAEELQELSAAFSGSSGAPGEGDDGKYSVRFESPVYEMTGECPDPETLCERERADSLRGDIKAADLEEPVRDFLLHAAERHARFDYSRIAEYYAHASAEVQRLMEDSGLVILDVGRAIERGFVDLTTDMLELTQQELDARGETP